MASSPDIFLERLSTSVALDRLADKSVSEFTRHSHQGKLDLTQALQQVCEGDFDSLDKEEISDLIDRLLKWGLTDDLTGLPNRRMLLNRLKEEHERSLRSEQEFSVLMLDIDRFGRVNDLHGHQEGDRILRCVANTTWRNLRKTDFLARYGGEEFCGILPDTSLDKARAPAERIRASVEALEEPAPTVSIGLAEWRPWLDPEKLVSCADHALYTAKENGRNRVEAYSSKRAPRKKPVAAG